MKTLWIVSAVSLSLLGSMGTASADPWKDDSGHGKHWKHRGHGHGWGHHRHFGHHRPRGYGYYRPSRGYVGYYGRRRGYGFYD